jgi:phage shock protein A
VASSELASVDVPALIKAKAELEKKLNAMMAAKAEADERKAVGQSSSTSATAAAAAAAPLHNGPLSSGNEIVKQLRAVNAQLTDTIQDKDTVIAGLREQKAALGKTVGDLEVKIATLLAQSSGKEGPKEAQGSGIISLNQASQAQKERSGNPFAAVASAGSGSGNPF